MIHSPSDTFFFTACTRVAVTYSLAVCSSIMQIHMHERCTYNSLSPARVTNAWRFAGSICQLAEKRTRNKKEERGKEGVGVKGRWRGRKITSVATKLRGSSFLASLKFLYIFLRRKKKWPILSGLNLFICLTVCLT